MQDAAGMPLYIVTSLASVLTWSYCTVLCCSSSSWRRAVFAATCNALILSIVQPSDRLAVSAAAYPRLGLVIFGEQGSPGLHPTSQHDTSQNQRSDLARGPVTERGQAGDHDLSAGFIHQGRQQPPLAHRSHHHRQQEPGSSEGVATTTGQAVQSLPTLPSGQSSASGIEAQSNGQAVDPSLPTLPSVQSSPSGIEAQSNGREGYTQPVFHERRQDGGGAYFRWEQFVAEGAMNRGHASPSAATMEASTHRPPALPATTSQPRPSPATLPPPPPPSHVVTVESLSATQLISGFQAKLICYIKMRVDIGILRFYWVFRPAAGVPGQYQEVRNVYSGYVFPPRLVLKPPNNTFYLESKVHIYNVQSRHSGHYKCQLTNENANGTVSLVAEDSIDIHVEDHWLAPALIHHPLQNVTALEGATVSLRCDIIGGLLLKFRFRFPNGSRIRTREHGLNLTDVLAAHAGAIRVMHRLTYTIHDISKRDSGRYTCQATNRHPESSNTRVTSVAMVYVEDRVIPSLFLSSDNIRSRSVVMGQNESLYCSSLYTSWHPPVSITWYKNGVQLPDNKQVQVSSHRRHGYDSAGGYTYTELSSKLSLAPFSAWDEGQYKCAVSSAQGSTEETVHLTAKAPPSVFIEQNKLLASGLQNQALLNLSLAADPLARVLGVFHDNRQLFCRPSDNCVFSAEHGMLTSSSSAASSSSSSSSSSPSHFLVRLVLKQVDMDSAGVYDLQVSTAIGTLHCHVHVQVVPVA